jgi:hypothetical protein
LEPGLPSKRALFAIEFDACVAPLVGGSQDNSVATLVQASVEIEAAQRNKRAEQPFEQFSAAGDSSRVFRSFCHNGRIGGREHRPAAFGVALKTLIKLS